MTKLKEYYKACNELAVKVSKKYADGSVYWVGGEIGGIATIGDAYLNMRDIALMAKLNPTAEQFWSVYWKANEDKIKVNLENLIKKEVRKNDNT